MFAVYIAKGSILFLPLPTALVVIVVVAAVAIAHLFDVPAYHFLPKLIH